MTACSSERPYIAYPTLEQRRKLASLSISCRQCLAAINCSALGGGARFNNFLITRLKMASEVTSRSRSQSLPRSSVSKLNPHTRQWISARSGRIKKNKPSDTELDTRHRYKQLKEPLLEPSETSITPLPDSPPPSEAQSAPEEEIEKTENVKFRKRAQSLEERHASATQSEEGVYRG